MFGPPELIYGHPNEFRYTNKTYWKSSNGKDPFGTKFHYFEARFRLIAISEIDWHETNRRGVTIYTYIYIYIYIPNEKRNQRSKFEMQIRVLG